MLARPTGKTIVLSFFRPLLKAPTLKRVFLKKTIYILPGSLSSVQGGTCNTYSRPGGEILAAFLTGMQVFFVDGSARGWAIFALFKTLSVLSFYNISKLFII
jgi:hypothetical protein